MILDPANLQSDRYVTPTELQVVDPLQIENWDEVLRTHPEATVFHSQAWARVIAETYHFTPKYLVARDKHRLWALLPLFEVRSWLTGRRGVSLPFTDRCSPLLSGSFELDALFRAAQKLGEHGKWRSLEMRGVRSDFAPPSASFYEHDLDLTPPESVLFEQCDPAMRRAIRKAQKGNVEIQAAADSKSIEIYYKLHQLTRKKHGVPPQPVGFFRNLCRYVIEPGRGTIMLASLNNSPIAGSIFLHFGSHSVYKFGASDPKRQDLRPNNLLMWKAIVRMKELGASTLSFGRSSMQQDGLCRFKRSFGAKETLLSYLKYIYKSSSFAAEEPDRSIGFHARLFRLCPAPLARVIGNILYPHVG